MSDLTEKMDAADQIVKKSLMMAKLRADRPDCNVFTEAGVIFIATRIEKPDGAGESGPPTEAPAPPQREGMAEAEYHDSMAGRRGENLQIPNDPGHLGKYL